MQNIKFDFANKAVVVTGGAQGIGLEIAEKFLKAGATVAVWDYSETALKAAEERLKDYSPRLQLSQVDVTNMASCQAAAARLAGSIDILVNNAGITRDKSFAKMDEASWQAVINTNLTGLFNVTKSLFEKFGTSGANRIVNMSSVVALYGNFGQTNYVAAKAGVIGLTKTWAREFAKKGFTVNAIAPGFTRTAMVDAMPPDVLKQIEGKVPVGRVGTVEDIANACLFLSSDAASYINGVTLSVDGGLVL